MMPADRDVRQAVGGRELSNTGRAMRTPLGLNHGRKPEAAKGGNPLSRRVAPIEGSGF